MDTEAGQKAVMDDGDTIVPVSIPLLAIATDAAAGIASGPGGTIDKGVLLGSCTPVLLSSCCVLLTRPKDNYTKLRRAIADFLRTDEASSVLQLHRSLAALDAVASSRRNVDLIDDVGKSVNFTIQYQTEGEFFSH